MAAIELEPYIQAVDKSEPIRIYGRITEITGLTISATGLDVSIGEACRIYSDNAAAVDAEVVGFKNERIILMATGEVSGIRPGSRVLPLGKNISVNVSDQLIGRIIDAAHGKV